jgi:hypothetical protein
MAIWKPGPSIGPQERLGRRLFDEPTLVGAADQAPLKGLSLRHFRDNREPTLSLDRMGRSNVEPSVERYLAIRAGRAAQKRSLPFHGWVELAAKELANPPSGAPRLSVVPSAITGEACEKDNNPYHCHVVKPSEPAPYFVELHLRHLFTERGRIQYCHAANEDNEPNAPVSSRLMAIARRVLRDLRRIGT